MDEVRQQDVDNLADVLWFIKGYRAYNKRTDEGPFYEYHEDSIHKAMNMFRSKIKEV
jgi:hypothetical protein